MILTCPDCATSYFVDDALVPPEGRVVKCSSCGIRWRAEREPEAAPAPVVEAAAAPDVAPEPEPSPSPVPPPADDIVASAPATASPEDVEIVAEPAPRRRPRPAPLPAQPKRPGAMIAWAALATAVVAALGVVIFREPVARAVPATSGVFGAIGLPVNPLGLTIDDVRSVATLQGGRPVLSITGAIRNTRSETVTSPALRVSILDRAGKPVAAKLARPLNAEIPPGAKRYFAIAIPDPPAGSASLDILFEARGAHTAAAEANAGAVDAHMAAEPMEATPAPEHHEAAAGHG